MTTFDEISGEAARKVLFDHTGDRGFASTVSDGALRRGGRLETDGENAADDLVRLVLALVETVRQLVEQQAIRRVESGVLSDDEIERLGVTLMRLEERMAELKAHFGMSDEDLALRLGTVQDLMDVLGEDGNGEEASPDRQWRGPTDSRQG